MVANPADIPADTLVHRIGGSEIDNLRLSELDRRLSPPGISVLLGGTPQAAADQMRAAFPRSKKWKQSQKVATSSAGAVRATGFELLPDPTTRFPNHARLIHSLGAAGFTDKSLEELAHVFYETSGC